jgi:hypothetical protein
LGKSRINLEPRMNCICFADLGKTCRILRAAFENIDDVKCISRNDGNRDSDSDSNPINPAMENVIADGIYIDEKIIILSNVESANIIQTRFHIDLFEYKLVHCSATSYDDEHDDGFYIFSRHGNSFFKWWYQDRSDKITIKSE